MWNLLLEPGIKGDIMGNLWDLVGYNMFSPRNRSRMSHRYMGHMFFFSDIPWDINWTYLDPSVDDLEFFLMDLEIPWRDCMADVF